MIVSNSGAAVMWNLLVFQHTLLVSDAVSTIPKSQLLPVVKQNTIWLIYGRVYVIYMEKEWTLKSPKASLLTPIRYSDKSEMYLSSSKSMSCWHCKTLCHCLWYVIIEVFCVSFCLEKCKYSSQNIPAGVISAKLNFFSVKTPYTRLSARPNDYQYKTYHYVPRKCLAKVLTMAHNL